MYVPYLAQTLLYNVVIVLALFMEMKYLTWEEIFAKRVSTWAAKFIDLPVRKVEPYKAKRVYMDIHKPSEKMVASGILVHTKQFSVPMLSSREELLFGNSNFFEVIFWEEIAEVNVWDFVLRSVDRQGVDKWYIEHSKYRKMICAGCYDRLAYINSVLPTETEDE